MRYFISPAERLRSGSVCYALLHRHLRGEGEERLGKERRGEWCNASKGRPGVKRGRLVVEKEKEHRGGEILCILPLANSNRAGGVQEEKAGGEVAKRVKSSGARNR